MVVEHAGSDYLKPLEGTQQSVINSRVYFSLKFLKKLNFGNTKYLVVYDRSHNIPAYLLRKKGLFISRGLYPVKYQPRALTKPNKLKYGMFSFTRKPFAIPEKKTRKKR